jgi:hypothetical protein
LQALRGGVGVFRVKSASKIGSLKSVEMQVASEEFS